MDLGKRRQCLLIVLFLVDVLRLLLKQRDRRISQQDAQQGRETERSSVRAMRRHPPALVLWLILVWGLQSSALLWFLSVSSAAVTEALLISTSGASVGATGIMEDKIKRRRIVLNDATVNDGDTDTNNNNNSQAGKLEALKQREAQLAAQLAAVRREKLSALRSRPLTIGIMGFGRFGQFIAKTFAKYGNIVVTSRSDYSAIAATMGAKYVPLSDPKAFLAQGLDVIVVAVSILSFESTIKTLAPHLQTYIHGDNNNSNNNNNNNNHAPLLVDVLSVKEHARKVMLQHLPPECDILCTHPMFGPDSGKDSWYGLNFVYEKTRIDQVVLLHSKTAEATTTTTSPQHQQSQPQAHLQQNLLVDETGGVHSLHEDSERHVEGVDRMERFLSIWEEEGCRMVPLSCAEHDTYAANSQFITHLVGRVLGSQGLQETPIDTSGFQSVLKLIGSTTADSFDLFYGLYKYNQNSLSTIEQLQTAMEDVVENLKAKEQAELEKKRQKQQQQQEGEATSGSQAAAQI